MLNAILPAKKIARDSQGRRGVRGERISLLGGSPRPLRVCHAHSAGDVGCSQESERKGSGLKTNKSQEVG